MQGVKQSIKQITVANKKVLKETAAITNTRLDDVTEIIDFVTGYVTKKISEGRMEGVMIPYFGKFQPRPDDIRKAKKVKNAQRNGLDAVYRAIVGKPSIKSKTDETI
jgi:nucleoid DNA-binding protein